MFHKKSSVWHPIERLESTLHHPVRFFYGHPYDCFPQARFNLYLYICHQSVVYVYIVKEVALFWGVSQLVSVASKQTLQEIR